MRRNTRSDDNTVLGEFLDGWTGGRADGRTVQQYVYKLMESNLYARLTVGWFGARGGTVGRGRERCGPVGRWGGAARRISHSPSRRCIFSSYE